MQEGQERDASAVEEAHVIDDDDDDENSAADTPDLWMPERNEKDTKFVRPSTDAIPTKKHPQPASELSIVQRRKKLFKELVKGGLDTQTLSLADQYLRDNVRDFTWQQNVVKFPNGKVWEPHHKWLAAPDPREHEDKVRYLTYGCAFRLVDGTDKQHQSFHAAPDTLPTVWVCMCSRKCMACYDISDKNTTPRDEHLKNAHNLEQRVGHGRKAALSGHQSQLQKQEAQATRLGMKPNRFHQLKAALFVIQTCQPFSVVETPTFRDIMHKDWIPCKAESIRSTVGEIFLVAASTVRQGIKSAIDMSLLPPFHLNADLWTSKVTGEKFLGVRVFWKIGKVLKTALLAVTAYNPPKVEGKEASEWLLEYIVQVLQWYGIRAVDVSGATSDAGPDCKKAFNVWARQQHAWTWLWCVTKYICSCMTTYTFIYVYSNDIHNAGATHIACTALLWRPWGHRQTSRRAAIKKCVPLSTLSARRLNV